MKKINLVIFGTGKIYTQKKKNYLNRNIYWLYQIIIKNYGINS